jgi:hypothetical protein
VPLQVIGVRVGVSLLGWMALLAVLGMGVVVNTGVVRALLGLPLSGAVLVAVTAVALQLVVGIRVVRRASWWLVRVWLRMR